MSFTWNNVSIEVINKNANIKSKYVELIKSSCGHVNQGEVLAIMGPSGGGKTTLLNILAGRIPPGSITYGEILYKDKPRTSSKWMRQVGYVDQDDIVYGSLSVEDTIKYAGRFRSNNFSNKRLKELLNDLELNNVHKNRMNKVSGGQRKRTMIAVELIADPEIIFLDEPTSGLDALTALRFVELLKKIAVEKNKIIILSIHQPNDRIVKVFDKILLLANAQEIYYGKIDELEGFFKENGFSKDPSITLSDFILEACENEVNNNKKHISEVKPASDDSPENLKDKSVCKDNNEFIINFVPNLYHIHLIILRKLQMYSAKTIQFYFTSIIKLIFYSVAICACYHFGNFISANITKHIGASNIFIPDNKKFELHIAKLITGSIVLKVIIDLQVNTIIHFIYDDHQIIQRELRVNTYGAASYFLSLVLIHTSVQTIVMSIIYFIFRFYTKYLDFPFMCIFMCTSSVSIIFALCVGSTTTHKSLQIILALLISLISSTPPFLYAFANLYFQNSEHQWLQKTFKVSYLFLVITPLHYMAIILRKLYNNGLEFWIDNIVTNFVSSVLKTNEIKEFGETLERYIQDFHLSEKQIYIVFFSFTFIWIIYGITMFGWNLMPERRLKLQKK